jgi:S-adenosylmethionine-diacylgycerolhomoserine-N-methlytransferase
MSWRIDAMLERSAAGPDRMGATVAADAAHRMDRMYRHQRHVYDLTRKYYLLGRDGLIRDLAPAPGHRVLEIGCGTGRNLVRAARRYPAARFFGVDVSGEMLASAARGVARAGLASRIGLARADATLLDPAAVFGEPAFERVYFSYTLSMIPDWEAALDRALAAVAPGGELQIVDFGTQEGLPAAARRALRRWLALFDVTPRDRLEEYLAASAATIGATLSVTRPYRGYAQRAVLRTAC